ncbi:hypothetical protein [Clostridium sp. B9]|uniref:hypothetical protein n=1 Tax=Clostridium sp. B9 TaxID=3423224 RepID=UPI003D2ED98E
MKKASNWLFAFILLFIIMFTLLVGVKLLLVIFLKSKFTIKSELIISLIFSLFSASVYSKVEIEIPKKKSYSMEKLKRILKENKFEISEYSDNKFKIKLPFKDRLPFLNLEITVLDKILLIEGPKRYTDLIKKLLA